MSAVRLLKSDLHVKESRPIYPFLRDQDVLKNIYQNRLDVKTPLNFYPKNDNAKDLVHRLAESKANCKIELSRVSMYLNDEWIKGMCGQIDDLMDIEEWDDEDHPIDVRSFVTMLRMILFINPRPERRPGLGATTEGNIIAMWTGIDERISIECLPGDNLLCIGSRKIDGDRKIYSSNTNTRDISTFLDSFNTHKLFGNDGTTAKEVADHIRRASSCSSR